ncbi:DUF1194 domain-containing protein [Roseivivax sp. CAU 1761]
MRLGALALAAALWTEAAWAQAGCRLALALALDVSSSVDDSEYALQREGLALALEDPEVRGAILGGAGPVALAIYEWSGRRQNALVLDWTMLHIPADIDRVTTRLRTTPRSQNRFPTAMGYALGFGATLLERGPDCLRAVIDISGDGVTNDGFGPQLAYRHFPFAGVTVNGLAVLGADPTVEAYYSEVVRHGPGAFVELSQGYEGFRNAMTRKLFRETNTLMLGAPAAAARGGAAPEAQRVGTGTSPR